MFTPLDVLYIVLAFCALWLSAAIFWLIWQVATIFKTVNDTLKQAQQTMGRIEGVLVGLRQRFEHASGLLGVVLETLTKTAGYFIQKQKEGGKKKTGKKMSV